MGSRGLLGRALAGGNLAKRLRRRFSKDGGRPLREKPKGLAIIAIMWGESYIDDFLRYALPTHLAERNVPGLSLKVTYLLFVEARWVERVAFDPQIARLRELGCEIEFTPIEAPSASEDKYAFWGLLSLEAARRAQELGYAAVWASPDILLTADALTVIEDALKRGYRALVTQGFRCCRAPLVEAAEALRRPDGTIALEAPAASELAANTLDVEYREWVQYDPTTRPAGRLHFMWCVGPKQFVFHNFKAPPMMVWPRRDLVEPFGTFDDRLVAHSGLHPTEVLVVNDTRRITNLSLGTDAALGEVPVFDPEADYDLWSRICFFAALQGPLGEIHDYQALQPILCNVPPERLEEREMRLTLMLTTRFAALLVMLSRMSLARLARMNGDAWQPGMTLLLSKVPERRLRLVERNLGALRRGGLAWPRYVLLRLRHEADARYWSWRRARRALWSHELNHSCKELAQAVIAASRERPAESAGDKAAHAWIARYPAEQLLGLVRSITKSL